ncbi:MAG: MOSC domain-containing protein [Candidatus Solibacter usitatus]|nr:MOSC domain-containing protein [Candidatus Solibacter usitatus]
MTGTVVQVNISPGGVPKRAIPSGVITPLGIEGDRHAHPAIHGGPRQALLLITSETIDELIARGYPLFYGALGENLTTRGLDRRLLRAGQRLRAGSALLELTKPRGPCSALDVYGPTLSREIYDPRVKAGDPRSPRWGMSGFYAAVIEPGCVHGGDPIRIEATAA